MLVYDVMEVIFGYVDTEETIRNINQVIQSEVIAAKIKILEDISTHSHDTEFIENMVGPEITNELKSMTWKTKDGIICSFKDAFNNYSNAIVTRSAVYDGKKMTILGDVMVYTFSDVSHHGFQDKEFKMDFPIRFEILVQYSMNAGNRKIMMTMGAL